MERRENETRKKVEDGGGKPNPETGSGDPRPGEDGVPLTAAASRGEGARSSIRSAT